MTDLGRGELATAITDVLRALLFCGGRASTRRCMAAVTFSVGELGYGPRVLAIAESNNFVLTLGSDVVLCRRGWDAVGLGQTPLPELHA